MHGHGILLIFLCKAWTLLLGLAAVSDVCIAEFASVCSDVSDTPSTLREEGPEILSRSSSGNPEVSSPLIDPAMSSTVRYVNCFKLVELIASAEASSLGVTVCKRLPYKLSVRIIVFMHCVRILIALPCPCVACYYVILEDAVHSEYIRSCALLSLMYSWPYVFHEYIASATNIPLALMAVSSHLFSS